MICEEKVRYCEVDLNLGEVIHRGEMVASEGSGCGHDCETSLLDDEDSKVGQNTVSAVTLSVKQG